jgi:serine/threonine protein kinase
VSREGDVKLMDFGIAKDQTADDLTREGLMVGSPSYLAPEVLGGEKSDARSDVWALGVTLYELACGQKPFTADTVDALFAGVRRGRFVPLRARAPHIPRRLANAIEKCLRVRPKARWQNANALARELEVCAGKYLEGFDPRGRLVALMAHRGFASEQQALTCINADDLLLTREADAEVDVSLGSLATPAPRPRRWAFTALVALASLGAAGAGAAYYLHLVP